MNPFNKMAGLITGAAMGMLLAVLQVPYAYYLFAKNRREKGSSVAVNLLATATIGTFFALGTGAFTIMNAWGMIGWGMKVGSAKGIMGAITLPYTFHTEFQRRLASENATSLFSQIGRLMVSGIDYLIDSNSQGEVGPSLFEREREFNRRWAEGEAKIDRSWEEQKAEIDRRPEEERAGIDRRPEEEKAELRRGEEERAERDRKEEEEKAEIDRRGQERAEIFRRWEEENAERDRRWQVILREVERIIPFLQIEPHAPDLNPALENNRVLLERIDTLKVASAQENFLLLNEDEIKRYKKAIQDLSREERQKKEEDLANYIDKINCPMTLSTSNDPITVVLPEQGPRIYDGDALKAWIEFANTQGKDARESISNTHLLKDLEVYKGYSPQIINFVNEVREVTKQWELRLANSSLEGAEHDKKSGSSHKLRKPPESTKRLSLEGKNKIKITAPTQFFKKLKRSNAPTGSTKENSHKRRYAGG